MQPFLLLFGTSLLTLAKAVTMTKVLAFLCATAGSILVAVANRGRIPLLKKLPRFVAPGSTEALVLSLFLLLVGGVGTAAGLTGDFGVAASIVASTFGGACLLFFDRNDLTGITKGGPGPLAFAMVILSLFSCGPAATSKALETAETAKREMDKLGKYIDKPGLVEAEVTIWREAFGRTDASPLVFIVEGAALTCTSDVNDAPGFDCPTVGCRQGCTFNPYTVSVAFFGLPWHQSPLTHENEHAKKMRVAIEVLKYTPTPAVMQLLADRDHKGPEWEPGGEVDQTNALLASRGQ